MTLRSGVRSVGGHTDLVKISTEGQMLTRLKLFVLGYTHIQQKITLLKNGQNRFFVTRGNMKNKSRKKTRKNTKIIDVCVVHVSL